LEKILGLAKNPVRIKPNIYIVAKMPSGTWERGKERLNGEIFL
jgi:hypothetical protein